MKIELHLNKEEIYYLLHNGDTEQIIKEQSKVVNYITDQIRRQWESKR